MKTFIHAVHAEPEPYRCGWIRGFYGAMGRSWLKHAGRLDDILRHGVRDEADHQFLDGYREGRDERSRRLNLAW